MTLKSIQARLSPYLKNNLDEIVGKTFVAKEAHFEQGKVVVTLEVAQAQPATEAPVWVCDCGYKHFTPYKGMMCDCGEVYQ